MKVEVLQLGSNGVDLKIRSTYLSFSMGLHLKQSKKRSPDPLWRELGGWQLSADGKWWLETNNSLAAVWRVFQYLLTTSYYSYKPVFCFVVLLSLCPASWAFYRVLNAIPVLTSLDWLLLTLGEVKKAISW